MSATLDAIGTALPAELICAECGDTLERGYVPVEVTESSHEPDPDKAICDTCGWRDVGYMGCAPELSEFDGGDRLVRIEIGDGGIEPVDVTDET